jgi:hypothetical protein
LARLGYITNLFAASQINEIKLSGKLLLVLQVLLLDVDQEHRVAARAVLIHVCKYSNIIIRLGYKRLI